MFCLNIVQLDLEVVSGLFFFVSSLVVQWLGICLPK